MSRKLGCFYNRFESLCDAFHKCDRCKRIIRPRCRKTPIMHAFLKLKRGGKASSLPTQPSTRG